MSFHWQRLLLAFHDDGDRHLENAIQVHACGRVHDHVYDRYYDHDDGHDCEHERDHVHGDDDVLRLLYDHDDDELHCGRVYDLHLLGGDGYDGDHDRVCVQLLHANDVSVFLHFIIVQQCLCSMYDSHLYAYDEGDHHACAQSYQSPHDDGVIHYVHGGCLPYDDGAILQLVHAIHVILLTCDRDHDDEYVLQQFRCWQLNLLCFHDDHCAQHCDAHDVPGDACLNPREDVHG